MNREQYDSVNNSYKKRLIFHLGLDAGFFSEYCNMLYAVSYCLLHKIHFSLYCKDANFGKDRGWQDYFLPFFQEVYDDFHHTMNFRFAEKKITTSLRRSLGSIKKVLLYRDISLFRPYYLYYDSKEIKALKKKYRFDFFTQDIWNDFNHYMRPNDRIISPFSNKEITSLSFFNIIDKALWRYNQPVQDELQKRLDLCPVGEEYIGIHIRRGDKISETKHSSLESYMDCVKKHSKITKVFVATDDYSTYRELCILYPEYNFFTLTKPTNSGYQQSDFNSSEGLTKYNRTLDLFADIEMLTRANIFVGTFTSNVGQFLIIHRNGYNCHMVDCNFHTL